MVGNLNCAGHNFMCIAVDPAGCFCVCSALCTCVSYTEVLKHCHVCNTEAACFCADSAILVIVIIQVVGGLPCTSSQSVFLHFVYASLPAHNAAAFLQQTITTHFVLQLTIATKRLSTIFGDREGFLGPDGSFQDLTRFIIAAAYSHAMHKGRVQSTKPTDQVEWDSHKYNAGTPLPNRFAAQSLDSVLTCCPMKYPAGPTRLCTCCRQPSPAMLLNCRLVCCLWK